MLLRATPAAALFPMRLRYDATDGVNASFTMMSRHDARVIRQITLLLLSALFAGYAVAAMPPPFFIARCAARYAVTYGLPFR